MTTLLLVALTFGQTEGYARPQLLLEPAELKKYQSGKTIILLDVRSEKAYKAGHVPGARHVDVAAWSKAFTTGEDLAQWIRRVGALGIDGSVPVVVYDDDRSLAAARIWWMLRHYGLEDVRLLNGGWKGWLQSGGVSETTVPTVVAGKPKLRTAPGCIATREHVEKLAKAPGTEQIVDARSREEHQGTKTTAKRNGAIPGAKHLEWSDTLDPKTGRFRSAPELKKLMIEAGIALDRPAVTYCQSGGRASVMAFVMELMTGKQARNYYRSWAEWGNHPDTPIVIPMSK